MQSKEHKKILIIAFSTLRQYPKEQLDLVIDKNTKITVISPYDFLFNLQIIKIKIYKFISILKDKSNCANHEELENRWATSEELAIYLKQMYSFVEIGKPSLIGKITGLLASFRHSIKDIFLVNKIFLGDKKIIYIDELESTAFVLDSLMRWAKHKPYKSKSLLNNFRVFRHMLLFRSYASWLKYFVAKNKFDYVLVNHTVYLESGWVASFLCEKFNVAIIHTQSIQKTVSFPVSRSHWFEQELAHQFLKNHDGIPESGTSSSLPWYEETSLANFQDLRKLLVSKDHYLIVMHAFSDANSIHETSNSLFQSYYNWVQFTLNIAKENPCIKYIFRIHPSTNKYYHKDLEIIENMFHEAPKNIVLEDPISCKRRGLKINQELPIVVTCQGSIALEMACSGLKVIATGNPVCPDTLYLKPKSLSEYALMISGNVNPSSLLLTNEEITKAVRWKSCYINLMR